MPPGCPPGAAGEGTQGGRGVVRGGTGVSPAGDEASPGALNSHLRSYGRSRWVKPPGATRCHPVPPTRGSSGGAVTRGWPRAVPALRRAITTPKLGVWGEDPIPTGNVPSEPTWTEWGAWGPCSRSCGSSAGKRVRRRSCRTAKNPPCPGRATEVQECPAAPCPGNTLGGAGTPPRCPPVPAPPLGGGSAASPPQAAPGTRCGAPWSPQPGWHCPAPASTWRAARRSCWPAAMPRGASRPRGSARAPPPTSAPTATASPRGWHPSSPTARARPWRT